MLELLAAICLLIIEPTSQPDLRSRLLAIDERAAKIEAIKADFVQEKQSPLLADPLITRGTIAAAGENVLWTAEEPEPTQTHIGQAQLQIYYPRQNVVEQYNLTPETSAMVASPLPRLDELEKSFEIVADAGEGLDAREGTVALRLNPTKPELAKYVDFVRVLLDEERSLVVAFETTDPDGETTLTRFENVQVNPKLDAKEVTLRLPTNVKRVSPGGAAK
jgi:outer membrane lipoprotein-sorting protein